MKKGFTLIEMMVVVVIIGILATIAVPRLLSQQDKANATKVIADIKAIDTALSIYKLDNGFFPSTEQGLLALVEEPTTDPVPMSWQTGGYLSAPDVPLDPWGTAYIYRSPGEEREFEIISLGADKKEGGEGYNEDINSALLR